MKRFVTLLVMCLSACNVTYDESTPFQFPVSVTSGDIMDGSVPITATKYVSFHADRSLRVNTSCTQVLRLNLVQRKDYKDTIIELKNRAVLMGGNAVSLIGWRESGSKTGLLGNIYICRNKTYHIHPHPQKF